MRNDTSATLGRRGAGWRPFALFAVLGALIAGLVVVPVSVARGAVPVETVPSAPVVIDVPPGAPIVSGLRTESGGDMILTVDPDPGSPAPTEYRVDARSVSDPGSPVVTVTGAGPQLVVSGLAAREVYDVTVVAVNASSRRGPRSWCSQASGVGVRRGSERRSDPSFPSGNLSEGRRIHALGCSAANSVREVRAADAPEFRGSRRNAGR
jgi:hypothetical protein